MSPPNQGTQNLIVWLGLISTASLLAGVVASDTSLGATPRCWATVGATLSFVAYANWGWRATPTCSCSPRLRPASTRTPSSGSWAPRPVTPPDISGISWVIGHILGTVLLSVALWRARVIPGWAALVLAVSQPMHVVAAVSVPSRALDVVAGWSLTTLRYLVAAIAIARTRNETGTSHRLPARDGDRTALSRASHPFAGGGMSPDASALVPGMGRTLLALLLAESS